MYGNHDTKKSKTKRNDITWLGFERFSANAVAYLKKAVRIDQKCKFKSHSLSWIGTPLLSFLIIENI